MLRHFQRSKKIDSDSLENSKLLTQAKKPMGAKLYNRIMKYFTKYVADRDIEVSGGYFKFAMVIGNKVENQKEADYIWNEMLLIFGDDSESVNHIKRVLGTMLMLSVVNDDRKWCYKDDPDKKLKVKADEIPDPTEYFCFG